MLKLTLNAGFSAMLRQKRIATLMDIHELFRAVNKEAGLTEDVLLKLEAAANEINAFYNTSNSTQREIELAAQQLANSSQALRDRIAKGRTHQGSIRSIYAQIQILSGYLTQVLTTELRQHTNSGVSNG